MRIIYLPAADVEVFLKPDDTVRAGLTIVARLRDKPCCENNITGARK